MIERRELLGAGAALGLAGCAGLGRPGGAARGPAVPPLIAEIQQRTFRYFWETTDPKWGLAHDRWPSPSFCSIAAVGFALTAYPIGVVNGWISRTEARDRTLATLRFFWNAPQGERPDGVSGYKGFFYHFLDLRTGLRIGKCELSSIDTTLLLGGVLFAANWFDRPDPAEAEIRDLARKLYARCDWRWFQDRSATDKRVSMGWTPESGFIERRWFGYTEGMLLYVLALGAEEFALEPEVWAAWCGTYGPAWRGEGPTRRLAFGPHFGHQYSHVWVDFRGIRDPAMRAAGFDYFENSRRATYAQRAYAIANPGRWDGYSANVWGLTACDGPQNAVMTIDGRARRFYGYAARGPEGDPDGLDDGTLAPTAVLGSMPFAPEIVIPATEAIVREHGGRLYTGYGFLDSFNPTYRGDAVKPVAGTVDPRLGWVDVDYLGIDQGPILAMIENWRSGLVWEVMRRDPAIRRGLTRAGFTGGWLATG